MKTVAYCNPLVPPEWIAAHGLRPDWMRLPPAGEGPPLGAVQGICPYARALLHAGALLPAGALQREASAVVVTTTCDQMRHAAGLLELQHHGEVFLLNVPRTWQTAVAGQLYLDELKRLGKLLVQLGGIGPSPGRLAEVMLEYQSARRSLKAARHRLSGRQFAEAVAALHRDPLAAAELGKQMGQDASVPDGIPLAVVGGPMLERDCTILDVIERAGGRVVLDATEGGQRTMPREFDRRRLQEDPLAELAAAYFQHIADPFRRPNHGFYEWLAAELAARKVRGLVLWRYVWCDVWHAELYRLKQQIPVPLLDLDAGHDHNGSLGRTVGRVEAFLEMLK